MIKSCWVSRDLFTLQMQFFYFFKSLKCSGSILWTKKIPLTVHHHDSVYIMTECSFLVKLIIQSADYGH